MPFTEQARVRLACMRPFFVSLLLGLALPASSLAQSACASAAALPQAAKTVATLRHQLHEQAVDENDPKVPPAIATELTQFKDALSAAAQAAFGCADSSASPEELEKTLAEALHANLSSASETVVLTRGKKDLGAYGSDLAVQVFPLFNSPRYVEVNFRYGIECGDDNLLLVFKAADAHDGSAGWQQVLRWGAPSYRDVEGAFGDFIMMTPLSGFPGQRNWRFVVAHGQPGCGGENAPSHFDLDLLEPSADPAQPTIVWHLDHPYRRAQIPRLSTTEDTLTFELSTPPDKAKDRSGSSSLSEVFRFHVTKDNQVEPTTQAAGAPLTQ